MSDRRYPIAPFQQSGSPSKADLRSWITQIDELSADARRAVAALWPDQVERPYRSGGRTVRQVIHHLADSHTLGYLRCRWVLTEDTHVATSYDQTLFMDNRDWERTPADLNLECLAALHRRLLILFQSLDLRDFERRMVHPDLGPMLLGEYIGRIARHWRHHLAHVQLVQQPEEGWNFLRRASPFHRARMGRRENAGKLRRQHPFLERTCPEDFVVPMLYPPCAKPRLYRGYGKAEWALLDSNQ